MTAYTEQPPSPTWLFLRLSSLHSSHTPVVASGAGGVVIGQTRLANGAPPIVSLAKLVPRKRLVSERRRRPRARRKLGVRAQLGALCGVLARWVRARGVGQGAVAWWTPLQQRVALAAPASGRGQHGQAGPRIFARSPERRGVRVCGLRIVGRGRQFACAGYAGRASACRDPRRPSRTVVLPPPRRAQRQWLLRGHVRARVAAVPLAIRSCIALVFLVERLCARRQLPQAQSAALGMMGVALRTAHVVQSRPAAPRDGSTHVQRPKEERACGCHREERERETRGVANHVRARQPLDVHVAAAQRAAVTLRAPPHAYVRRCRAARRGRARRGRAPDRRYPAQAARRAQAGPARCRAGPGPRPRAPPAR